MMIITSKKELKSLHEASKDLHPMVLKAQKRILDEIEEERKDDVMLDSNEYIHFKQAEL